MAHLRGGGGAYSRRRRAIVIEIFKCAQPDETYRPGPEAAWKVHNCCCSCNLLEVARLGDDHEIGKRLGHARKRRVVLICHDADARLRRRGGAADTARTKTENTSQHADARKMTRSIFSPICFGNPMQLTASALSACLLISAGARSGRHQTRLAAIAAAPPSEEFNSFAAFIKKQQDALVAALEATDGSATFERDPWRREDGTGEGCM